MGYKLKPLFHRSYKVVTGLHGMVVKIQRHPKVFINCHFLCPLHAVTPQLASLLCADEEPSPRGTVMLSGLEPEISLVLVSEVKDTSHIPQEAGSHLPTEG